MTYKEESYVLNTLKEIQEHIRSPAFKQLVKETHENNIMLKSITRYLANEAMSADKENQDDFGRNILANLISERLSFGRRNRN